MCYGALSMSFCQEHYDINWADHPENPENNDEGDEDEDEDDEEEPIVADAPTEPKVNFACLFFVYFFLLIFLLFSRYVKVVIMRWKVNAFA